MNECIIGNDLSHSIIVTYFVNNESILQFESPAFPTFTRGQELHIITHTQEAGITEYNTHVTNCKITTIFRPDDKVVIHNVHIMLKDPEKKKAKPKISLDFDTLWDLYPRKHGRKDAERHFTAQIKDEIEYDKLKMAIEYYARKVKAEGKEDEFILMGSTFFNSRWRDYHAEAVRKQSNKQTEGGEGFSFFKPEEK